MPPEAETAEGWLNLARRGLAFLETLDDAFPDMVLFHAQQVVEKSVKAVRWWSGATPPFTHSLETLLAGLPATIVIPDQIRDAAWLSEAYIVVRYYTEEPEPTAEQVREAREAATAAVAWASTLTGR